MAVDLLCFLPRCMHLHEADRYSVRFFTYNLELDLDAINLEFSDILGVKGVILSLTYFSLV